MCGDVTDTWKSLFEDALIVRQCSGTDPCDYTSQHSHPILSIYPIFLGYWYTNLSLPQLLPRLGMHAFSLWRVSPQPCVRRDSVIYSPCRRSHKRGHGWDSALHHPVTAGVPRLCGVKQTPPEVNCPVLFFRGRWIATWNHLFLSAGFKGSHRWLAQSQINFHDT